MIGEGKYPAKVIGAGLSNTKGGNAQCFIRFEALADSGPQEITWYGSLKTEKSTEFAIKNLVTAGFAGNDFADMEKPIEVVFIPKDLTITIENSDQGKPQVKWINVKGNGPAAFVGAMPKAASLFAKIKDELGVTAKISSDDTIPF